MVLLSERTNLDLVLICVSVLLQRRTKGRNSRRIQSRIFNKSILFSGDTIDEPEQPESGWEEVGPQSQRTFQRYGILKNQKAKKNINVSNNEENIALSVVM